MRIDNLPMRTIWHEEAGGPVTLIDQTALPHRLVLHKLHTLEESCEAIRTMRVRGAPLIGATAAHGLAIALAADSSDDHLNQAYTDLLATRPTAVNLRWALDRVVSLVRPAAKAERAAIAFREAIQICDDDVRICEAIGETGLPLLRTLQGKNPERPVQVLTHCNAGWLATVDWGTALAPIYKAHDAGIPVHVWVDETRPRNQGASLTAFELREHGVPHTVVVDNAGGHLMQRGKVDAVIVGSDRTTAGGDVCNKIGTYLKALAAQAHKIPFYVALPSSTIDWEIRDGIADIPIEDRDPREVREMEGESCDGQITRITLFGEDTPVANPAFDVTPASLVTSLITEHGIFEPNVSDLTRLAKML